MRRLACVLACGVVLASLHCGSEGSAFPDGDGGPSASGGNGGSGSIGTGSGGTSGDGGTSGASGGPSCATATSGVQRVPVYLDIVLDGSRSMDGHGNESSGCDDRDTDYDGNTCFLEGAREQDPLAPNRTERVCHKEGQNGNDDCPAFKGLTGKKWIAIRGALQAFFEVQAATPTPRLGVGLYLFKSSKEKSATEWDVKVGMVEAAQGELLWNRIKPGTWPSGGTPLRGSINGQAELLRGFEPAAPLEAGGRRAILLVTDGVPNGDSSDADVVTAVQNARNGTPEVVTAVIGVGNTNAPPLNVYNETFLSTLAFEGGVAPEGCNKDWDGQAPTGVPCHTQVTPGEKDAAAIQAELTAAIDSIALSLQSCELVLDRTSPIDPNKVNVVFDDGTGAQTQVAADAANGWTYDNPQDPTKVILNGAACAALKANPKGQVSIVVGCPTGTVVR